MIPVHQPTEEASKMGARTLRYARGLDKPLQEVVEFAAMEARRELIEWLMSENRAPTSTQHNG